MRTIKKTLVISSLLIITFFQNVYSQDFTKNSIKFGIGIGMSSGNNTDGLGFLYSVGYQREIWKDRLRLNPNFSFGHYSSKFIMDARDQYFNSTNFEINLFFDLIKIKSFSFFIGVGAVANNTRGLKGTGGMPDPNITIAASSEYISDFHFGGYLGGGFRVNLPNERVAFNFIPFNLHFGNKYFMEFHPKVEIDIKL